MAHTEHEHEYLVHLSLNWTVALNAARATAWWAARALSHLLHGVVPTSWTNHEWWGIAPHGMPAEVRQLINEAKEKHPSAFAAPSTMQRLVSALEDVYSE